VLSLPRVEEVVKSILTNIKNLLADIHGWTSQYEKPSSSEEILNELEEIQEIVGKIFTMFSPKIQEEKLQEAAPKLREQKVEEKPETVKVEKSFLETELESKIVPPFDMILNVLKPGVNGAEVAETLERIKMDLGERIGGLHPLFFKMTKVIARIRRKRALTQEDVYDLKQLAYQWSIQSGLTT